MKVKDEPRAALVLAMFGTTHPEALTSLISIRDQIARAFPRTELRVAITSHQIRNVWRKRAGDPAWRQRKDIPSWIFEAKGLIATIGDLQDDGFGEIVVQPTFLASGEQFMDLSEYIRGINSIKTVKEKWMPFKKPIALGRPLLGTWGTRHDYHEDIAAAVAAIRPEVEKARDEGAALVYMAHGNEYLSSGIYAEFEAAARAAYPGTDIVIGTVEGYPGIEQVADRLMHCAVKKAVLAPFLIVAGDHARNDMAGPEPDSWKNVLASKGIEVIPVIQGLGEFPGVGEAFADHIRDAAQDGGIGL